MRPRSLLPRFPWAIAIAIAAAACSSPGVEPTGGSGGRGGSAGGNPGNPNPGGGQPPAPIPPGNPNQPPPNPGGGGVGEETCTATSAKATPLPVDLFVMQDKSASMMMPAQAGMTVTKWDAVKGALTTFLQSPSAAGISVGLGLFPTDTNMPSPACMMCTDLFCLIQCGCVSPMCGGGPCRCGAWAVQPSCTGSDYARPTIPVEPLPAVGPRIIEALNRVMLSGGTPTYPALEGAIQYARTHEMNTRRRIAIALATDGVPTGCEFGPNPNTVANVSTLARNAAAGGINTFVIGVGPALNDLNAVAAAGGTTQAFLVANGNVEALINALKAIQTMAAMLACSFNIPPPPMGQTLDPNKVNVSFAPAGVPVAQGTQFRRVADRAACGPMGGWYYDDPMMPTRVNLCDASCKLVNMSPNGELSLQFGCKTRVIE